MIAILLVRLLSPFFLIIEVAAYFSCICVENIQVIQRIRIVFKMQPCVTSKKFPKVFSIKTQTADPTPSHTDSAARPESAWAS